MIPTKNCIDLVSRFEGFFDHAYKCPAGVWTIGWGTTHYPNGAPVKGGDTCTKEQADGWLMGELAHCGAEVEKLVKVALVQNQFDALCSFAYNCGTGALAKSSLLTRLNEGKYDDAANEFLKWNRGGGKVLPGLVRRRNDERNLFLTRA